jgi:hypothetical protein
VPLAFGCGWDPLVQTGLGAEARALKSLVR